MDSGYQYPDSNTDVLLVIIPMAEGVLRTHRPLGFYSCMPFGNKLPVFDLKAHLYDVKPEQGRRMFFDIFLFINRTDFNSHWRK